MKVALVADWLPVFAGAEHVIEEFCALWPDAPLYTTVARRDHLGPLNRRRILTGRLQWPYRLLQNHKLLLPWMPQVLERIDLRGYDAVLSSSHAVGKGIIPPSGAVHVCYCHTPMRYAWEMEQQYLADFRVPKLLRKLVQRKLKELRRWDLTTAKRVDAFVANSSATQERIRRIYNRESTVIPPPVNDEFFDHALVPAADRNAYFLAVGRLVPYKRFDLLITAANALRFSLKIVGTGSEASKLKRIAGPTVEFLGYVPDEELPPLYAHAKALLFPQVEDAGVVPLEAQACGTPVIALGEGGICDTVIAGKTGIFFAEQTVAAIGDALCAFAARSFSAETIRSHAQQYSARNFREQILQMLEKTRRDVRGDH
ncbi:MAG: glycosyltransferase [Candidatus Peribacteraceae bacterium]|nr:glycosyltransferase [Candidatus Peribacteraceae bacterium]